tara:strand:- start:335 stop:574 length:240 start_codon:yes stop_codon:yes gene_type:complete
MGSKKDGFHYVTFGFDHVHDVDGNIFDKDCVARISASSNKEGREKAFDAFGPTFCTSYHEDDWNEEEMMQWFPRGYIDL